MKQVKQNQSVSKSDVLNLGTKVRSQKTGRVYEVTNVRHFCGGTSVGLTAVVGGARRRANVDYTDRTLKGYDAYGGVVDTLEPWSAKERGYQHQPASAAQVGQYKIIGCWMSRITRVKHNSKTTVIFTANELAGVKYPSQCDVPVADLRSQKTGRVYLDSQGNPLKPGDTVDYRFAGTVIRTTVKHLRRDGHVHIAQGFGGANVYATPNALTKVFNVEVL